MEKIINFFKELQDRYLIVACFVAVGTYYYFVRTDAVLQLWINFGVAIIALSKRTAQPEVKNDVQAETLNIER